MRFAITFAIFVTSAVFAAEPAVTDAIFEVHALLKHEKQHIGTAFYVDETHLLTAAHTIKDGSTVYLDKAGRKVACLVLKIDERADICLLECEPSNARLVLQDQKTTGYGFYGFKRDPDGQTRGTLEKTEGMIIKIKCSNDIRDGHSGEPLIDSDGCVFGMGVSSDGGERNCNLVPAAVLRAFIAGDSKTVKRARE